MANENWLIAQSDKSGTEMCRSCHLQPSFSFSRLVKQVHTYCRCPDVVTAACTFRHLCGAGSIPAWGSAKTNEEVLAKLLT